MSKEPKIDAEKLAEVILKGLNHVDNIGINDKTVQDEIYIAEQLIKNRKEWLK